MKNCIRLLFAAALLTSVGRADVIEWGFEVSQTPTSSFDSLGNAIDSSYTFYLGKFADSFTPTRSNYDSWLANWTNLDTTTYNDTLDWFNDSENLNDNNVFANTDAAFIWGTNVSQGATGEVVLLNSVNWIYPTAEPTDPSVTSFVLTDAALAAPVGAVNSTYTGEESGITTPLGSFDLQTERIPEPTAALLIAIGCLFLLFRRTPRQPA
ncbi:MAG: PEP-CTERM sorting domain-containing protein [Verrucomicrobiales bacterium]|nr:PEP-CTERM sorting domain-containing protein [Verrucomicrobiales bacterium]